MCDSAERKNVALTTLWIYRQRLRRTQRTRRLPSTSSTSPADKFHNKLNADGELDGIESRDCAIYEWVILFRFFWRSVTLNWKFGTSVRPTTPAQGNVPTNVDNCRPTIWIFFVVYHFVCTYCVCSPVCLSLSLTVCLAVATMWQNKSWQYNAASFCFRVRSAHGTDGQTDGRAKRVMRPIENCNAHRLPTWRIYV